MKTFLYPTLQIERATDEEVEMSVNQSKEAAKSMLRQGQPQMNKPPQESGSGQD